MGINSTSLVTITLVFLPLLPAILFGFKNWLLNLKIRRKRRVYVKSNR
jgi:hypothetical protein